MRRGLLLRGFGNIWYLIEALIIVQLAGTEFS